MLPEKDVPKVIQNKIGLFQHGNGDIYVAKKYRIFLVYSAHIFLHKSAHFYSIYLTFGEVLQYQIKYFIFLQSNNSMCLTSHKFLTLRNKHDIVARVGMSMLNKNNH